MANPPKPTAPKSAPKVQAPKSKPAPKGKNRFVYDAEDAMSLKVVKKAPTKKG